MNKDKIYNYILYCNLKQLLELQKFINQLITIKTKNYKKVK